MAKVKQQLSPLDKIRAQAKAKPARPGSGYSRIGQINKGELLVMGPLDFIDAEDNPVNRFADQRRITKMADKARVMKITKRKAPFTRMTASEPEPPKMESWRPAGGDRPFANPLKDVPSTTLGVAQIPTWRLKSFQAALEAFVGPPEVKEWLAVPVDLGGESVTDIYVMVQGVASLNDLTVATMIYEILQDHVVEGRKLQVTYA